MVMTNNKKVFWARLMQCTISGPQADSLIFCKRLKCPTFCKETCHWPSGVENQTRDGWVGVQTLPRTAFVSVIPWYQYLNYPSKFPFSFKIRWGQHSTVVALTLRTTSSRVRICLLEKKQTKKKKALFLKLFGISALWKSHKKPRTLLLWITKN